MAKTKKKKKPPKYALLIWEEVGGDKLDTFLIPLIDLDKRHRNWLRRCHGNYVNSGGTTFNGKFTQEQIDEALIMVNELIANPQASWLDNDPDYYERQATSLEMPVDEFTELYGSWHAYKITSSKPKTVPRVRVIVSGFVM